MFKSFYVEKEKFKQKKLPLVLDWFRSERVQSRVKLSTAVVVR